LRPKFSTIVHALPAYRKALPLSPLPVCLKLIRIIACTISTLDSMRQWCRLLSAIRNNLLLSKSSCVADGATQAAIHSMARRRGAEVT
jgi:hypothetical protein